MKRNDTTLLSVVGVLLVLAMMVIVFVLPHNSDFGAANRVVEDNRTLGRTIDAEAGVVCWYLETGSGTSLSCLPIEHTRLGIGDP